MVVFACMHKHLPVCPAAQVCWQLYVFYYGVTESEPVITWFIRRYFYVFRVTVSVKLYLTISAAYAAYSGSFFSL